jgi:hypothetical protein
MNVNFRTADVNGIKVFHREAGRPTAPAFPRKSDFLLVHKSKTTDFLRFYLP